jgi:hypothetical protein
MDDSGSASKLLILKAFWHYIRTLLLPPAECNAFGLDDAVSDLMMWLERAERIRTQQRNDKNKLYALHAPEVECLAKGKARKPYEFGVKSAVVVSHKHGLMPDAGHAHIPR